MLDMFTERHLRVIMTLIRTRLIDNLKQRLGRGKVPIRQCTRHNLITRNTQRPYITTGQVALTFNNLRTLIIRVRHKDAFTLIEAFTKFDAYYIVELFDTAICS